MTHLFTFSITWFAIYSPPPMTRCVPPPTPNTSIVFFWFVTPFLHTPPSLLTYLGTHRVQLQHSPESRILEKVLKVHFHNCSASVNWTIQLFSTYMATDMYGLWDAGGVSGKEVLWTSGEGVGFPKAVKKVVVLLLPSALLDMVSLSCLASIPSLHTHYVFSEVNSQVRRLQWPHRCSVCSEMWTCSQSWMLKMELIFYLPLVYYHMCRS